MKQESQQGITNEQRLEDMKSLIPDAWKMPETVEKKSEGRTDSSNVSIPRPTR